MTNQGTFCVTAIRSGGSIFGPAMSPVRENGEIVRFETPEAAWEAARRRQAQTYSQNVRYVADGISCWG